MKNKCILGMLIILISVAITGCGKKRLEKISLSVDKLISINESKTIKVEYEPKDVEEEIIWSSSNEDIASIENGIITAKSEGKVTIIATTTSGIKDEVNIEIYRKVENITLDNSKIELTFGNTTQINATIEPLDATYKDIIWSSSDNDVASVENGIITAKHVGNARITASTKDGISSECIIYVIGTKENVYYNEKIRWGMSIEEVKKIFGSGSPIYREPDVYVRYLPSLDDYYKSSIENYVYWFNNSQLRAYWLDYNDGHCTYNSYLDIRNTLSQRYGNPSSENYDWEDQTYKNDEEKWADAFRYDDFTIKTNWNQPNFNIVISWKHSTKSCTVSYSQKEYTSRL